MSLLDKAKERLFGAVGLGEKPEDMEANDQPDEDQKLAGYIKSKIEHSRAAANRVAHEGIWMTNIAYLLGFDSVYYDTQARQFRPLNTASNFLKRNRLYSNQILPACQNRLARLCKQLPKYEIRPNSPKPEDRDAARLALDVLVDLWERQEINRKRIPLIMWVQQCGHAYLKVCYDPTLGDPMLDDSDPDDEVGPTEFSGDVRVDVVSAFEVFPDPLAKSWDDIAWVAQCKVRPIDYFRVHYPEKGEMVKAEGAWLLSLQYEQRINSLNSIGPSASGNLGEALKNSAIEIVYYEKRSSLHPKGRKVIVANGVILANDELIEGEIPLVKFDDVMVAGKFYPESVITHARPLQQQYNRDLNKGAEWINHCLAGKWMAEKRHGLAKEALNDRTEVIEYNAVPGAPEPHATAIPQLPSWYFEHSQQMVKDLNVIFGLSEVSRGQLPSAGIPAVGMQLLVEQDETRIGIEVEQHEHAYAKLGEIMLKYAGTMYKMPRKLKTKEKNGEYKIREYTGEDLKRSWDVKVVRGSTIPTSRSIRRQEIMNSYQQGLLGAPQDPAVQEQVLSMMEFGYTSEMWKDRSLKMAQIHKTIDEMEKGIVPEVNEWDDHRLHFKEKNEFRISDRFAQWPKPCQDLLIQDMESHIQAIMEIQNPGMKHQMQEAKDAISVAEEQKNSVAAQGGMGETGGAPQLAPPQGGMPNAT